MLDDLHCVLVPRVYVILACIWVTLLSFHQGQADQPTGRYASEPQLFRECFQSLGLLAKAIWGNG